MSSPTADPITQEQLTTVDGGSDLKKVQTLIDSHRLNCRQRRKTL